jgi:hypothetical protein
MNLETSQYPTLPLLVNELRHSSSTPSHPPKVLPSRLLAFLTPYFLPLLIKQINNKNIQ